jgi:hypothetical protein
MTCSRNTSGKVEATTGVDPREERVAKLVKSFEYAPWVLRVRDELRKCVEIKPEFAHYRAAVKSAAGGNNRATQFTEQRQERSAAYCDQ